MLEIHCMGYSWKVLHIMFRVNVPSFSFPPCCRRWHSTLLWPWEGETSCGLLWGSLVVSVYGWMCSGRPPVGRAAGVRQIVQNTERVSQYSPLWHLHLFPQKRCNSPFTETNLRYCVYNAHFYPKYQLVVLRLRWTFYQVEYLLLPPLNRANIMLCPLLLFAVVEQLWRSCYYHSWLSHSWYLAAVCTQPCSHIVMSENMAGSSTYNENIISLLY